MAELIRGLSENGGVVFCGVDSTDIVCKAEQLHKTSATCSAALGRLLTGAALMGSMLKDDRDSITLRVNGGGPAGLLIACTDGTGNVKGCIEHPLVEMPPRADGHLDVGGAVGKDGVLTVIRDNRLQKEPTVGQVPLVSGEIAEDLTAYYAYSEQIPTVCALGVLVDPDLTIHCAGGYLIQLLPGATDAEITRLEENIAAMPSVTEMLRAGLAPAEHRGLVGLHRDDLKVRKRLAQPQGGAGQRAAGADGRDEDVHAAAGVAQNLLRRRRAVRRRIGGILELLGDQAAGMFVAQRLGAADCAGHALGAGGQDQFRPVSRQKTAALDAHRLGHRENETVPLQRRRQGQTDARVAAGRLNDQRPGLQPALAFGRLNHRQPHAVLHAAAGIEILGLRQNLGLAVIEAAQGHERRVADGFEKGTHKCHDECFSEWDRCKRS